MNETIFYFFYGLAHQAEWLGKLIVFFAVYFPYVVMVGAGAFLIWHRRAPREFAEVFFSGAFSWILSKLLKLFIQTPRPFQALAEVRNIFPESGYGFPSGHAAFFFGLAFSIFIYHKRMGYWFLLFALLVSLGRIASGVHFPGDILGGFFLGTLVAYLLRFLLEKYSAPKR